MDSEISILVFWRDGFTRESLVEGFRACGYKNTHGIESLKLIRSSLKNTDFQILLFGENDLRRVSSKLKYSYPSLQLVVLTLHHDLKHHKLLRIRGAHGVLVLSDIRVIFQKLDPC